MTIGARFRNGPTTVQMDTFFANHALLTSGAINLAQNADTTITVNAQYPILAFTGTGPISILSAQLSGGTWSFDLFCQATGGCVGTYYVFDVVQDASPGYPFSIGLRLRNPDTGAITYRSDRKYMRVVNVRTMEMPTPVKLSAPISEALPQAGLAAVIANPGGRVQTRTISITLPDGTRGDATEYTPYQLAATVNGTTLLYGSNDTRFTTINEGNDQLDVPCTLLLVDISNF